MSNPLSSLSIGPNGDYQSIANGFAHAVAALSETWPCKAWMVLKKGPSGWVISCLEDHLYGLAEGDVFDMGGSLGQEFIFSRGVSVASQIPRNFSLARGGQKITVTPIVGHIFHPIIDNAGEVYGGILGLTNVKLDKSASRALPVISLLSELIMQTQSVCQG